MYIKKNIYIYKFATGAGNDFHEKKQCRILPRSCFAAGW